MKKTKMWEGLNALSIVLNTLMNEYLSNTSSVWILDPKSDCQSILSEATKWDILEKCKEMELINLHVYEHSEFLNNLVVRLEFESSPDTFISLTKYQPAKARKI